MFTNSTEKAEILSKQFKSVLTTEDTSTIPDKGTFPYPSILGIDITLNLWCEESFLKILLKYYISAGPDNIHADFL